MPGPLRWILTRKTPGVYRRIPSTSDIWKLSFNRVRWTMIVSHIHPQGHCKDFVLHSYTHRKLPYRLSDYSKEHGVDETGTYGLMWVIVSTGIDHRVLVETSRRSVVYVGTNHVGDDPGRPGFLDGRHQCGGEEESVTHGFSGRDHSLMTKGTEIFKLRIILSVTPLCVWHQVQSGTSNLKTEVEKVWDTRIHSRN